MHLYETDPPPGCGRFSFFQEVFRGSPYSNTHPNGGGDGKEVLKEADSWEGLNDSPRYELHIYIYEVMLDEK